MDNRATRRAGRDGDSHSDQSFHVAMLWSVIVIGARRPASVGLGYDANGG